MKGALQISDPDPHSPKEQISFHFLETLAWKTEILIRFIQSSPSYNFTHPQYYSVKIKNEYRILYIVLSLTSLWGHKLKYLSGFVVFWENITNK